MKLPQILSSASIIASVFLIVQIQLLPHRISESIRKDLNLNQKDTVIKPVTADIPHKGDLVYFEGKTTDIKIKIDSNYQYNPNYPTEFWNGWLTLIKSTDGGKYFLWTSHKLKDENITLKGWFMSPSAKWQYDNTKEYLSTLIPVVQREEEKLSTN